MCNKFIRMIDWLVDFSFWGNLDPPMKNAEDNALENFRVLLYYQVYQHYNSFFYPHS